MKKLLFCLLTLPVAMSTFAQQFNISEQAGASFTNGSFKKNGFADQVAVSYLPVTRLAISAFYEYNGWQPSANAVGVAVDGIIKHLFLGLEAKTSFLSTYHAPDEQLVTNIVYTYKPVFGLGIHVGAKQRLLRHIKLVEQVGYVVLPTVDTKETSYFEPGGVAILEKQSLNSTGNINYFYARVGLSFGL